MRNVQRRVEGLENRGGGRRRMTFDIWLVNDDGTLTNHKTHEVVPAEALGARVIRLRWPEELGIEGDDVF